MFAQVFLLPNRRESMETSPVVLRRKNIDKTEVGSQCTQSSFKRHSASSVTIRSSGFTCYLDGPPETPTGSHSTPSTLRGLQNTPSTSSALTPSVVSPKTSGIPTKNYLVECSSVSNEMAEFWEMAQE